MSSPCLGDEMNLENEVGIEILVQQERAWPTHDQNQRGPLYITL